MSVRLNIFTGTLQFTDSLVQLTNLLNGQYLKLDQTAPQMVINGAPDFHAGIDIGAGSRLILDGA